jgi:hypothetical protein
MLKRTKPLLIDLNDLARAIEACQHTIDRQAKVCITPPEHQAVGFSKRNIDPRWPIGSDLWPS